jgi:hypothetical protein
MFFFQFKLYVSMMIYHNTDMLNVHSNEINVLPQLGALCILFKFYRTKAVKQCRYIRCLWFTSKSACDIDNSILALASPKEA